MRKPRTYRSSCFDVRESQITNVHFVTMPLQLRAREYTSGFIIRSGCQSPNALLTRVCGTLVVMVPHPRPRISVPEWYSYQRTDMDHSFTPECPNSRLRSSMSQHSPIHRECYRCVCAMALWRSTGSTSSRRSGLVSAHRDWVSQRRGGRRGLADWLCSCKICVLVCMGSQRLIRSKRSPYSLE